MTKPSGKPFTTIARAPLELDGHRIVALGPPRMVATETPEDLLRPVEAEVLSRPFGRIWMSDAYTTDPPTGRPMLVVSRDFGGTDYFLVEFFDLGILETDLGVRSSCPGWRRGRVCWSSSLGSWFRGPS